MTKFLPRENHWNWKGGIYITDKFCPDCGKKITYQANKCKSCSHKGLNKYPKGWKNNKPKCIDCGNFVGRHSNAKRCQKCYLSWQKGKNSPCWRGGISKDIKRYRQRRLAIFKKGGELSLKTIQSVYEDNIKQYKTLTCYLCLKPIIFRDDSLDHKIPLIRGGTNKKSNLAIAHRSCNSRKNKKTYEEYISFLILN